MSSTPIGIDLGTTYSAVAVLDAQGDVRLLPNAEGDYLTPSVIFFEEVNKVIVGQVAKDARNDAPERVIEFIKRAMGTDYAFSFDKNLYSPIELSSLILKKLRQDAQAALSQPVTQAVVTCPAYFGAERRDATEKAARLAGIEVLALLNEPTAAALAFGMGGDRNGHVLVFDLGGGTFDVTLLHFHAEGPIEVLLSDGDAELGGKDFDDAIMQMVAARCQKERGYDLQTDLLALVELRDRAEKAKLDLTTREATTLRILAGGQRFQTQVTRDEFAQMIRPLLEGMKMTIQNVLDDCGLTRQDIADVLLVGGSTRVPAVRQMLRDLFGREPNISVHPDEAVARGAALFAAKLLVTKQPKLLLPAVLERARALPAVQDVAPHSIGVTALDDADKEENSIILQRGQQLPATIMERYQTRYEDQTSVKIDVNEGESEELDYVRQLGSFVLRLPEARPKGSPIDVRVALDLSSIIRVTAIDVRSGEQEEIEIDYHSNLDEAQMHERTSHIDRHQVS